MGNNFYFFGDSICFGQYVSVEKTWVCKTAAYFNRQCEKYVFMNPSVPGNTTRDALNRFSYDVLSRNPDCIYMQFGMNDCNIWETVNGMERVPKASFAANLKELYDSAIAQGVKTVIFGTNHPSAKNAEYDLRNAEYNEITRAFCRVYNIRIIDNEKDWETLDHVPLLLPDGIHLNELGHDYYYMNFITNLSEIL